MKIKTQDLANDFLVEAVKRALPLAKSQLEAQFKTNMSYGQLIAFVADRHSLSTVCFGTAMEEKELLVAAILNHFPMLIDDEDALIPAGEDDMWPLSEQLLDWYQLTLSPSMGWWYATGSGITITAKSPREAVLRWFAVATFGTEYEIQPATGY